jgi:hypothetical protein
MKTNIKQNNWLNQTQAKLISSITGMMVFTASLLHAQDPVTFTDDFEGTALNPFWSTVLVSGTITFPSSAQVHSGTQSLQVNSINTVENKWIRLRHTFNQPQYGQVSIWVYDSGADLVSGNYISLNLMNDTLGKYLSIGTMDYDLGPDNGGHYYYHAWDSQQQVNTPIDRTLAWHQFTIIANQNYVALFIDGQNIYNGPGGIPFETIEFNVFGPSWRPAMTVYFDDFKFSSAVAKDIATFMDDFEGPTLNPFWSKVEIAGTISFPSTAQVHSGTQAVQFNSTYGTGEKGITLHHNFNTPQYGQISIWVYDSGADLVSGNYISVELRNDTLEKYLAIGTQDYDLGPDNGGHYYYHAWDSQQGVNTPIDRTRAWHQFTLIANQNYASLYVDNQNIYNGPGGIPFESINISISGPTWRPAMTVYFDDFTFSSAFPELSMRVSQVEISWNSITNKTYKI